MKLKSLYLLLNGDYSPPARLPESHEPVIAVDGGIRHAHPLAVQPHLWLGDFDSSRIDDTQAIPRQSYPIDKDQTDLELALAYVNQHYPHHVIHLIGSDGNEPDHNFGNLWCLPQQGLPVIAWQKNATIISVRGAVRMAWQAAVGAKVSLYAISTLQSVSSEGLRWCVTNVNLAPYCAYAARNEMAQSSAQMSWQAGDGFLFLPPRTLPEITIC